MTPFRKRRISGGSGGSGGKGPTPPNNKNIKPIEAIEAKAQSQVTIIGGLSWVEFHRLANRVIDAMDPYKGKGHLYTPEEIDRSCAARSILAEELAALLGKCTITDQTIANANRVSRVLKFNKHREHPRDRQYKG